MLKHEIEFDGKKIALDKKEILDLVGALEPYYVAIMMGTTDFEIPNFVRDYIKDQWQSRTLAKKGQPPKTKKVEPKEEPQPHYENNVYDFEEHRKQQVNK